MRTIANDLSDLSAEDAMVLAAAVITAETECMCARLRASLFRQGLTSGQAAAVVVLHREEIEAQVRAVENELAAWLAAPALRLN